MNADGLLLRPLPPIPRVFTDPIHLSISSTRKLQTFSTQTSRAGRSPLSARLDFRIKADDGGADGGGSDDYEMAEEELEEVDNKKDYDVEYEPIVAGSAIAIGDEDIVAVHSKSFVSTKGWDSKMIVNYRINGDEFHKICLFECDFFFIRKPPDPDSDVYDFREMYGTPPDTDIYAIPKVLALIHQVFLTKHYRNRRLGDPDFVLDFVEIYVIDCKTKSITRARVMVNLYLIVTVPGGRKRDRKSDLLVVRDNGNSFKIMNLKDIDDPTTVIEKKEWETSRQDMERHLRKLRDFSVSNWF